MNYLWVYLPERMAWWLCADYSDGWLKPLRGPAHTRAQQDDIAWRFIGHTIPAHALPRAP